MKLSFERSIPGRRGVRIPQCAVPSAAKIEDALLRKTALHLPELSETDVSRHYLRAGDAGVWRQRRVLSARLLHDEIQSRRQRTGGLAGRIHPESIRSSRRKPRRARSKSLVRAKELLCQLVGMEEMTFQPAAGAHGEFLGLLLIKRYHETCGDCAQKEDHRAGFRARHEPRDREHGGLYGGQYPLRAGLARSIFPPFAQRSAPIRRG